MSLHPVLSTPSTFLLAFINSRSDVFTNPELTIKKYTFTAEVEIQNPQSKLLECKVNENGSIYKKIETIEREIFTSIFTFDDDTDLRLLPKDLEERRIYMIDKLTQEYHQQAVEKEKEEILEAIQYFHGLQGQDLESLNIPDMDAQFLEDFQEFVSSTLRKLETISSVCRIKTVSISIFTMQKGLESEIPHHFEIDTRN
jgi:hypothetical protein